MSSLWLCENFTKSKCKKIRCEHLRSCLKNVLLQLLGIKEKSLISESPWAPSETDRVQYMHSTFMEQQLWGARMLQCLPFEEGGCCIVSNSALKQRATRECFLKLLDQCYLAIAYSSLHKAYCSLESHSSVRLQVRAELDTRSHNVWSTAIQYNLCKRCFFCLQGKDVDTARVETFSNCRSVFTPIYWNISVYGVASAGSHLSFWQEFLVAAGSQSQKGNEDVKGRWGRCPTWTKRNKRWLC